MVRDVFRVFRIDRAAELFVVMYPLDVLDLETAT